MGSRIWAAMAVLFGVVLIAAGAYEMGLSHGAASAAAAAGNLPPYAYYGWGWHRPWGFGFGFPIFFLFLFFWLTIGRGLLWGGPWRRHHDYYDRYDAPRGFDDWHRRAHERMGRDTTPPPQTL